MVCGYMSTEAYFSVKNSGFWLCVCIRVYVSTIFVDLVGVKLIDSCCLLFFILIF